MSLAGKFRKLYDYYTFHPRNLIVEPTNKCNLTCAVCFRSIPATTPAEEGFISIELFDEILAKSQGVITSVSLYFRGEPLLHPELDQLIERCKKRKFTVSVSTNGLLLTPALITKLIHSGLDRITIDYDDIAAGDYEAIRSVNKADAVLRNIQSLHRMKKEMQQDAPEISIKALNRGHDQEAVLAFVKRLEDTGISGKAQVSDCFPWPNGKIRSDFPYHLTQRPRVCDMYYQGVAVTYRGDIVACSYDYQGEYSLGHIGDYGSIADVYKERSYRLFRRRLLFKNYQKQKPCNSCLMPILGLAEGEYALNTLTGSMYHA